MQRSLSVLLHVSISVALPSATNPPKELQHRHMCCNVMLASAPMSGETSACLQLSFRYRMQDDAGQGICMHGLHADVSTGRCVQNCPSPTQFGLQPEICHRVPEAEHSACVSHSRVRKLDCCA